MCTKNRTSGGENRQCWFWLEKKVENAHDSGVKNGVLCACCHECQSVSCPTTLTGVKDIHNKINKSERKKYVQH